MRIYVTHNWGYQDSIGYHDNENMVIFNTHPKVGVYVGVKYQSLKLTPLYILLRLCYNTNEDGSVRK